MTDVSLQQTAAIFNWLSMHLYQSSLAVNPIKVVDTHLY